MWPKGSKHTVGWTDGTGIGSSDALGFGNNKGQGTAPSAPDDLMPWPTVHPTVAFKTYRDAPKLLLQHRMNRRLDVNSAVHPTSIFETYSAAPSEKASAPDDPRGRRCIALVYVWVFLFNDYIRLCEWPDDPTLVQGWPSVHPTVLLLQ
jgi:hypothetical protein